MPFSLKVSHNVGIVHPWKMYSLLSISLIVLESFVCVISKDRGQALITGSRGSLDNSKNNTEMGKQIKE